MLDADGLTIIAPIAPGLEHRVKMALEALESKRRKLFVLLSTEGGIVEVAERIVRVQREHYAEVKFIIPDRAMSAGTVLAMSGDAILMDYHSCLGPIDPQVPRGNGLVPALSYLAQYNNLVEISRKRDLTDAEFVLLQQLDLGELHRFTLARDLSISLLKEWLTKYKFKDWVETSTNKNEVTNNMREQRATEIAEQLSDQQLWLTHSRGIDMRTLQDKLKLKMMIMAKMPNCKRLFGTTSGFYATT